MTANSSPNISSVVVVVCAFLLAGCESREKVVNPGTPIRHDDFEYTVRRIERLDRIGERRAGGTFYLVTFEVENGARRVNHAWGNDIAYVTDGQARYENDPAAQEALAAVRRVHWHRSGYVTPPGGVETTTLVFDVPADVKEPYLKVRGSFLMGDLFDANLYRRTRVRLF